MSSGSAPVLPSVVARPPQNHIVQFYKDDSFLIDSVGQLLANSILAGEGTIVLATREHIAGLSQRLAERGVDVAAAIVESRYLALDAAQALAAFMVNGEPDEKRFAEVVGGLIGRAQGENGHRRRVVAFGEMVAILWLKGQREAAIRLEQLWNSLAKTHEFTLCCAYPMSGFHRQEHRQLFLDICAEHLHVIPAETHGNLSLEEQRLRAIAELQRKVTALETEIRLSDERTLLLQDASGLGNWELDLVDESVCFSRKAQQMLGVGGNARLAISDLMDLMYYSGDRDAFRQALELARRRKEFAVEFRLRVRNQVRVFATRGRIYYNSGEPLILGILIDVTPSG